MKNKIKYLVLTCINLLIVILIFIELYNEYKRVGEFQWVNQNAIEDHEELYLTPIFVTLAILGLASIIYETMKLRNTSMQTIIAKTLISFFRTLSYIYGASLLIISFISISITLNNIGNHDYVRGFAFSVSLFLLILLTLGILGGYIIYNDIRNKSSN